MNKFIAFIAILMMFPMYSLADRNGEEQVILHKKKIHGGHLENYPIADMPDAVYYDSEAEEIIIVADGTSLYYYEIEASGVVRLEDGFKVEKGATFAVYPSSF